MEGRAGVIPVVPAPRSASERPGVFAVGERTRIRAGVGPVRDIARLLREQLAPALRLPLEPARGPEGDDEIVLAIDPGLGPERYRLIVTPESVRIVGGDPAGLLHGTQTLRQLLPPAALRRASIGAPAGGWTVPCVEIDDHPAHRWRGLMLDVARHFLPVRDVLRVIDLMALHHLDVLHLHLTDDQGWRIDVAAHPRLAEVGGWRASSQLGTGEQDGRPHGGVYRADDIREIVAYAADRFIDVVPEIETPGHARAALAAYPELAVGGHAPDGPWTRWGISDDVFNVEESTIRFLCEVLDEVMDLFPSAYIGIGGDECPKTRWREDPRTQERMRELGLDDEEQLQAWFVGRLEAHLRGRGRRAFGWDEILEGGAAGGFGPGTTVASWRGEVGARIAARRGFDVVACPADRVYLDYRQSERDDEPIPVGVPLTWRDVHAFEPVPSGLTPAEAARILGGQGNLWTEHVDGARRVDYQLFPRLGALAEALWTGPDRDVDDFARRLPGHLARLEALGVEFRPEDGPLPWQTLPGIRGRVRSRAEHDAHIAEITANLG
jgi:hexosaminidase